MEVLDNRRSLCSNTQAGRKGRTARKRIIKEKSNLNKPSMLSHDVGYVNLFCWLKQKHKTNTKNLFPANFYGTGRGLMTSVSIKPGKVVLSIPYSALITTDTVLSSKVGHYIKSCKVQLTPHQALCVFLMYERSLGSGSDYASYIDILPTQFTTPIYFHEEELELLPPTILPRTKQHLEEYHSSYSNIEQWCMDCWRPLKNIFTKETFKWGWHAVNTRSVYLELPQSPYLKTGKSDMCLAPVLDLMNHSPQVKVQAGLHPSGNSYDIITYDSYKPYEQVFICYGAHDNTTLLLEYGFTVPHNPNNFYRFSTEEMEAVIKTFEIKYVPQKTVYASEANLKNLDVCEEGLSWQLEAFLRLLAMNWTELQSWKRVLLGELISEGNEKRVNAMGKSLLENCLKKELTFQQKFPSERNIHEELALSLCQDNIHMIQGSLNRFS